MLDSVVKVGGVKRSGSIGVAISYLRLIDSCSTQLRAQRPSWTFNKNKKEEEALRSEGWRVSEQDRDRDRANVCV